MIVWRNGAFIESGSAIPAANRGFLVGDGVFETMLVKGGKPAFLTAHLVRLRRGAAMLEMDTAFDEGSIRQAINSLASRLDLHAEAVCRITVSRSGGARGVAPSKDAVIDHLIALHPVPALTPQIRLVIAQSRRFSGAATNSFKCVGAYAPNLLARMEAVRAGADESIMLNEHGRIACASAANIFLLAGDALVSPPVEEGAMPGVTRAALLEIAAEIGVAVRLEPIPAAALDRRPLLITNSVIGVAHASLSAGAPVSALASFIASAYEQKLKAEFSGAPA